MPLQTFLNLPESRQEEIRMVAFKEFALYEYNVASLGNIIKELGLAKGSFYRYFKDKKEVYFYLIAHLEEIQKTYMEAHSSVSKDFFDILSHTWIEKLKFDLANPLFSGFEQNVMQEKNNEEVGNIQLEMKKRTLTSITELLQKYTDKKTFRNDIEVFEMAYLILQVQWGMFDYLELKHNLNFRENIKHGQAVTSLPEETLVQDVKELVQLVQSGLKGASEDPGKKSPVQLSIFG